MAEGVTAFKVTWFRSPKVASSAGGAGAGRLALVTMDNGRDHTRPNTLGPGALASLEAALDAVEAQPDTRGLLLTGKPHSFAAGADLEVLAGATATLARDGARRGQALFGRLRQLPFPTLAAVNGACLGGGLELALHCDWRTVSAAAGAIAFPEVFLSIVPGWGGTQLAPRIVGAANALTAIVHHPLASNRMLRPAQAVELGFADHLLDPGDFLDRSRALLESIAAGQSPLRRSPPPTAGLDEALAAARRAADERVHGASRAPYVAADLVAFAARGGDLAEGLRREQDALAELLPAGQAQASFYSLHLTQRRVRRQPGRPAAPARKVGRIGVVGAGLMGAQLGALLLQRLQVPLVVKDVDARALERSRGTIEGALDKRVGGGRLRQAKAGFLKSVVTYTREDPPLAGCDVVVEAVREDLDLKQRVFAAVERVVEPGCVLATNTSSLSVTAMASVLAHPQRVVGFHVFNPVAVLPLVEVVRTDAVSDEALSTAFQLADALGKSAVACADSPGFVVNRLLTRLLLSCVEAANRGAGFAEVDDAITALGLPMGPFELLGLIGLPVVAEVVRVLHDAYPERFRLEPNLQMLADSGLPGVYDRSRHPAGPPMPYEQVRRRWRVDPQARKPTPDEIRQQALEALAREARIMLHEAVVADARDIDTCMLLGAGWPFFMGGVCKHLDQLGISRRLFGAPLVGATDQALA